MSNSKIIKLNRELFNNTHQFDTLFILKKLKQVLPPLHYFVYNNYTHFSPQEMLDILKDYDQKSDFYTLQIILKTLKLYSTYNYKKSTIMISQDNVNYDNTAILMIENDQIELIER